MTIDSFRCTQCPWQASGRGAEDAEDEHWRRTHHAIDTIPPAETDWSEGYRVVPMRYQDLETFDDGDPGVRQTARILAGTARRPAQGDCMPDGSDR